MPNTDTITIVAGHGLAVPLEAGRSLRVVNTHGNQVVDTWAFVAADSTELLSMAHCREVLQRITFEPGDRLITNRYRPILTFTADTSPGRHDTLIAACSREMYLHAGRSGNHRNCADNLVAALKPHGITVGLIPSPWNLFMLAPVVDGRSIEYQRPHCHPGDYVEMRAEMDCLMVFSACPDDVYPTNGGDGTPVDAHVELVEDLDG
jgi:uncharacterized protein YcgI (DUF1989 family)